MSLVSAEQCFPFASAATANYLTADLCNKVGRIMYQLAVDTKYVHQSAVNFPRAVIRQTKPSNGTPQ